MRETFTLRKSLRQIFSREFFSLSGEITNVLCEASGRVFVNARYRTAAERAEPVETAAEALRHSASELDGLRPALDAAQSLAVA